MLFKDIKARILTLIMFQRVYISTSFSSLSLCTSYCLSFKIFLRRFSFYICNFSFIILDLGDNYPESGGIIIIGLALSSLPVSSFS